MKNLFKRFITCSVAACLIAATALTAACTPDKGGNNNNNGHTDPTKSGYSITLLYPDDTPVKGSDSSSTRGKVGIQLMDSDNNDIKGAYADVSEYGKANILGFKQSGEFLIDVINCPRGYAYSDKVTTVAGRGDYTVKLSATTVSYTINVTLPDGLPASGVTVTIKKDGTQVESAVTDTSGTAVISDVYAGIYDVELTNLPDGVSYLPTQLTASVASLDIELITLNELKLDELMSAEKLQEWDELANSYDESEDGSGSELVRFDKNADCYDFTTVEIPEGKKVYYYFTADKAGEYHFVTRGKYYEVEFYGSSLGEAQNSISSVHESSNTSEMVPLILEEGEKCYFSYSIPARSTSTTDSPDDHELSGTREFMIAKPVASTKIYEANGVGTYTLDFETATAILVFNTPENVTPGKPLPTEGGIFEIRSNTNLYDVKIEFYAYFNNREKLPDEVEDDISETDKNFLFTVEVPPSYAGSAFYFKIIIKSRLDGGEIIYPAQVPVIITRTGDAKENMSPVEYRHATASEKYPEQSGKTFHYLIGSSTTITENEFEIETEGGAWYVNVDGNKYRLLVSINKNLPRLPYSYATVEYMGDGDRSGNTGSGDDGAPSVPSIKRQNNSLSLYENASLGEDKTNTKFNFTPFIEEYKALCNSDGVYPVNKELKDFLVMYYEQHWPDFTYSVGFTNKNECCWLFSCGYYA